MHRVKSLSDGWWGAIVDGVPHPDGRRRQITVRESTKAKAQAVVLALQQERLTYSARRQQGLTLGDLIGPWAAVCFPNLEVSTIDRYQGIIDLHLKTDPIWGVPLRNLTESQIREFHARLRLKPGRRGPTLAKRSLRHIHALVRQILKFAVDQGEIDTNPALKVALPRVRDDPSKIKSWTVDETGRFSDLAKTSTAPNSRLWWAFFGFLVCTGLRRGEGAGLRWADVDFESGTITIRQTRLKAGIATSAPKTTASARTFSVGSHAVRFLRELKAIQESDRALLGQGWTDSGFVLTLPDGLPPSPDAITRRFRRDCERFGLTYITIHGLRHTFATQALQAGVPIHLVSQILGHSSIAITLAIYSHVMPGDTERAMETVGEFVFGGRSATQN